MRSRHVTVERTLLAAYLLSICGVVGLGAMFYSATRQEIIASDWVTHTESVIGDIEAIHRLTLDAESTGRAFLVSGNEENLASYKLLVPALYKSVAAFKVKTADNLNQQHRSDELITNLDLRFQSFGERLEIRRQGGWDALKAMPYDGRARVDMDRITATLRAMVDDESRLLTARRAMREATIHTLWNSIASLILLGIGMLSCLWRLMFAEVQLRRAAEERAREQAYHDGLTGLPNRRKLREYFGQALSGARRHGDQMAILFVDLDGFKHINDRRGHAAGDALLTEVAQRLGAVVRREDIVARVGGDEFVIVLQRLTRASDPSRMAERVIASLALPYAADGDLSITASVGIAIYPDHGHTWGALSTSADGALYAAKRGGKNKYVVAASDHDLRLAA